MFQSIKSTSKLMNLNEYKKNQKIIFQIDNVIPFDLNLSTLSLTFLKIILFKLNVMFLMFPKSIDSIISKDFSVKKFWLKFKLQIFDVLSV